jgi:hypothetical protein
MPRVASPAPVRVANRDPAKLAVVGLGGGLLSGLLGIGGGSVVVPLLVLWLMWEEHLATATSLGALTFAAVLGAAAHGYDGNVDVARAALVGIPAVAGVLIGTRIASRLHGDVLLMLFAAIQLVVAGAMIFG